MKKYLLIAAALFFGLSGLAYATAGWDISTVRIADVTAADPSILSSTHIIPAFDQTNGDVDWIKATDLPNMGSPVTYSTALRNNPEIKGTYQLLTSTQVGNGANLLASTTGKVVRVHGFSIYSSGNAATATTVTIECGGGIDIAAIPVAMLTSATVIGQLTSAPSATAQSAYFTSASVNGCPAGDGVNIRTTGSTLTGSTAFGILLNYTWQ